MKELCQEKSGDKLWAIAIYDDNNYVLFDKNKPKHVRDEDGNIKSTSYKLSYFNAIELAVRELARRLADERCFGLSDWIKQYQNAFRWLEEIVKQKETNNE